MRVLVQAWEEAGRPQKDLEGVLLARLPSAPSDVLHEGIRGFLTAVKDDARRRAVTRTGLVTAVAAAIVLSIGLASAGVIAYRNAQAVLATATTVADAERKSRVQAEQRAMAARVQQSALETQIKQSQEQVLKSKAEADALAAQAATADAKYKRQLEQLALDARTTYETARKSLDTTQRSLEGARQDSANAQRQLTILNAQQADAVAQRDKLILLLAQANDSQDALRIQLRSEQQRVDALQGKLNETSAKLQTTLDAYNKVANSVPLDVSPL
jgi:chromosome segregation ATPase